MIEIREIKIDIKDVENKQKHLEAIANFLNVSQCDILEYKIVKRAIDARNKRNIHYKFNFVCKIKDASLVGVDSSRYTIIEQGDTCVEEKVNTEVSACVVGSGPSGLFCALSLLNAGVKVVLLERGECIEKRVNTVNKLLENGEFVESSNIQFGEGGAGTFSDGKLNTGIKSPYIKNVLDVFYQNGAKEDILYDSKPHIGTDILQQVVVNMRNQLIKLGATILFQSKFEDFDYLENGKIEVYFSEDAKRNKVIVDHLVLAVGYSARDTLRKMYQKGMSFKQKAFSLGYRIEHLQENINKAQYGLDASKMLPPADYKLFTHLPSGRTVYTFCMCPGGVVVPSMSAKGEIVTNGMSYNARDGKNANSALLVSVDPIDFGSDNPLAGMDFQEKLEKEAFIKGNGSFICTLVGDFLKGKGSTGLKEVVPSIKPKYNLGDVSQLLPDYLVSDLRCGIIELGKKLKGFDSPSAVLTGIETRSSAPFMIERNQTLQTNFKNVYAIGEGAGMAGGIVSSAVDGIKIAKAIIEQYKD